MTTEQINVALAERTGWKCDASDASDEQRARAAVYAFGLEGA